MKSKFFRFPLILFIVLGSIASSAECEETTPTPTPSQNSSQNSSKSQKFSVNVNFGYSGISYGNNPGVANFASSEQNSTSTHVPLAIDVAGLLQVSDTGTALGVGYDGILDSYSPNGSGTSGSVNQTNFVGTIRHYFGDGVGHGAFLRGDVGIGIVTLSTSSTNGFVTTSTTTNSTFHGLFLLGGAGYSFDVSPHVNLSLEGDYGRVFLNSGAIGEWQPKAGILISF